jgi:AcrR family transcriptional regulator
VAKAATTDGSAVLGRRERKKAQTREAIQQNAMRLFRLQGYSATTIEQIAEAADISQTTFFRYFPTKEDTVLRDDYDPLLIEALRAQPSDLQPISALRTALRQLFSNLSDAQLAEERQRHALIVAVPELRARILADFLRTVRNVAEVIAERTGRAAEDFEIRNLAGAVTGVVMTVYLGMGKDDSSDPFPLLDRALAHLEAGLPAS